MEGRKEKRRKGEEEKRKEKIEANVQGIACESNPARMGRRFTTNSR